jgi:hypothetical protein
MLPAEVDQTSGELAGPFQQQNDFLHINRIRKLPGVVLRGFRIVEVLEDTIWSINPQQTKILEADGILDNFCLLEDFVGHGIAGLLAGHSLVATDYSWRVGFAFGDIRRGAVVSLISGMDIPLILHKTDTGSWALVEYAELNNHAGM